MKLAFSLFKYFPYGGIQRDLLKFVREARARGHEVRVYVIRWDGDEPDGVEVLRAPVTALSRHQLYERFADWVRGHLRRHPVDLHVGMNKIPGLDVYYAGDSCYEEKARTQRGALYRLLPRYRHFAAFERAVFAAGSATEILMISDVQKPFFRKYYGTEPERFHLVPPGIDRDRVAPADRAAERDRFRADFQVADDEQLLLFLGSGFIKKGLDRVLLGLHALPRTQLEQTWLFVVGRDNAEPFRRMAKRLGIAQRVRFFADGRDDVPRFLFGADGLVLPAYDENAGMVILEAMVAGLPALVTANCGYAAYLAQADAGLVTPAPFEQSRFNDDLLELLTSDRRSQWSVNGLALAEQPQIYALAETAVDHFETFAANRPLSVAFALFKYFPYGGLQRDFLRVASACRDRGDRVRIYTLNWDGPDPVGMNLHRMSVPALANHRRYRQFARKVAKSLTLHPVDVVVGFNKMPGLDLYYAADPCYEEKARLHRSPLYRFGGRYRLFSRFERAVFDPAAATQILLISPTQKTAFQQCYATPDERFHLLPPGVSPARRPAADRAVVRAAFRNTHELAPETLLLLFIGSGFITKGLDRLLDAVAALPPQLLARARLFVVGEDQPRVFQNQAQGLGIADRVHFFGGREDIGGFLLGADLLVHPAYVESGGMVLLEAMINGLPVLATDVCGFAGYVTGAEAGELIETPFDQQRMNAQLARILVADELRARWHENGLRFGESAPIFDMPDRVAALILACASTPEQADGAPVSA